MTERRSGPSGASRRGSRPVVLPSVRGSSIDPSAHDGSTSKVGIDATKPLSADAAMFDRTTL